MSSGYLSPRSNNANMYEFIPAEIPAEPEIMLPVQREIRVVAERQTRNQFIKRSIFILLSASILFVIAYLVGSILWSRYESFITDPIEDNEVCQKRVIGYYSGWENRNITGKQIEKLTHLIYNGIKMKADGKIEFKSDERRILFFDMRNKVRNAKLDVKVLFSTDYYSYNHVEVADVMRESRTRRKWIDSIASFILEYQLDGVELYYRWPESKKEKDNYVYFLQELRYQLSSSQKMISRQDPFIICVVTPHEKWSSEGDPIIHEMMNSVDFFNVETDNFYSPGNQNEKIGPFSPLFSSKSENSVDHAMRKLVCKTGKPSLFNLKLSFRGTRFENVKSPLNETDQLYRYANIVNGTVEISQFAWRDLKKNGIDTNKSVWHEESKTPYIWDWRNRILYSYEDKRSLELKMRYAASRNLGGIAIRQLEYDDDSSTLFNTVTSIDTCLEDKFGKDEVKYNCEK